jgi:hypothetical protein
MINRLRAGLGFGAMPYAVTSALKPTVFIQA